MSLVKVSNSNDQVEMNTLEYLIWKDGWNGGTWSNWDVVNNPNDFNFYVVSDDNIIKVEVVQENDLGWIDFKYYGVDEDYLIKNFDKIERSLIRAWEASWCE